MVIEIILTLVRSIKRLNLNSIVKVTNYGPYTDFSAIYTYTDDSNFFKLLKK